MAQRPLIYAHFLDAKQDPYTQVKWVKHKIVISDTNLANNRTQEVEAPENWSAFAIEIAANKYFRRTGVPKTGSENSIRQMIYRVAHTIRKSGESLGKYFTSQDEAEIFEKELTYILLNQVASFNSPVWFNCGLYQEYQIKGDSEQWSWNSYSNSPEVKSNAFESPQCSACFIQSVEDDLSSIFELAKKEARIFKFGSGSGTNFSKLRSKSELLVSGGHSSGVMSFLKVLDKSAGAIRSGGMARRAAKMVILDIDHPEIEEFIAWKQSEEDRARALVRAGFSLNDSKNNELHGSIYEMISGQNSNNSVRVTDAFMQALERNEVWETKERTTQKVSQKYQAQHLWDKIIEAAWACGDPGVQFHDTIQKWHTCSKTDSIFASNPCSEFMFLNDSACNLASINLAKFLNENGEFKIKDFQHTVRVLMIAMDILVDFSSYPTKEISQNSHNFRPLGLGFTNLGAFFMQKGFAYGSQQSCDWASAMTALMTAEAYRTSALLASHIGSYECFEKNKPSHLKVLNLHKNHFDQLNLSHEVQSLQHVAGGVWEEVLLLAAKFGLRNAQVTLIAPTGTIGLLMDCDTLGIEPEYSLIKNKELFEGDSVKLINRSIRKSLQNLNYTNTQIDKIESYLLTQGTLDGAPHLNEKHLPIFDCAISDSQNQRRILPEAHLSVMSAVQPFISGAISKTVNLPNSATISDVAEIYLNAWKMGLKSIAVYRDGSKVTQVLSQTSGCEVCDLNIGMNAQGEC